jgi:hypothetical protein
MTSLPVDESAAEAVQRLPLQSAQCLPKKQPQSSNVANLHVSHHVPTRAIGVPAIALVMK